MASSFSFDITTSSLAPALWFDSYFRTALLRKIRKGTQWAFVLFLFLFLLAFVPGEGLVSPNVSRILLGLTMLTFAYGTAIFLLEQFGENLQRPSRQFGKDNLAEFLSFHALGASQSAIRHAKRKRFFATDSKLLLYFLLKESPSLKSVFFRMLLDPKDLHEAIEKELGSQPLRLRKEKGTAFAPDFQETIHGAIERARVQGRERAEVEDVLATLSETDALLKRYLIERNFLPERDVPNVSEWHYQVRTRIEEQKKFWIKKNLRRKGALGKDWAAGYTITLDEF